MQGGDEVLATFHRILKLVKSSKREINARIMMKHYWARRRA